jgi:predicted O-methyltransferase YrrM
MRLFREMRPLRDIFSSHKTSTAEPAPMPFRGIWEAVARLAAEMQQSEFMQEMMRRYEAQGSQGVMGQLDCATLYALTRWRRPSLVIESGGYLGMSSAFLLKALADEGLTSARLYSIEWNLDCPHGILIPEQLRAQFIPLREDVRKLVQGDQLPAEIDMFVHDSSHRYRHMLWEFREFWPRLRDGGLLVSHDVHFTAAFSEFVTGTYAHDKRGLLDPARTSHYEWGRWGYLGFAIKKELHRRPAD